MKKLFSSSKLAKAPPLGPEQYVRLAAGNLDVISQGTSDERALGRVCPIYLFFITNGQHKIDCLYSGS